jgi:hypothetical protein
MQVKSSFAEMAVMFSGYGRMTGEGISSAALLVTTDRIISCYITSHNTQLRTRIIADVIGISYPELAIIIHS